MGAWVRHKRLAVAVASSLALSLAPLPAAAESAPQVLDAEYTGLVRVNDLVSLSGVALDLVEGVEIDSRPADFFIIDEDKLSVRIPKGIQPGDVLVSLTGEFGEKQYQNLFEVSSVTALEESRVTIGTFQGYAAVYTKNFKGRTLRIRIEDRDRMIPRLDSNYTQNLTKVGAGRLVTVKVYLDSELVKSQELLIQ